MSVKHIRDQLQIAISKNNLRELQYTNYVVEMMFERSLIEDELYNSMADYLVNVGTFVGLSSQDIKDIKAAAAYGAKKSYTRRNIIRAHKNAGYKVFTAGPSVKTLAKMKRYAGMRNRPDGRTLPRSNDRLACYIPGGGFTSLRIFPMGLAGNMNSIPVTYAGMVGKGGDSVNRKVHQTLFRNALRFGLRHIGKFAGRQYTDPVTGKTKGFVPGAISGGKHRFRRLHGPIASKDKYGNPTGAQNDTSAPLVAAVEKLRDLDPSRVTIPKKILSPAMYTQAHHDIIQKLDAEFTINSTSISNLLNLNKTIEIGMALGGDVHQELMSHADKENLEKVLDKIVEDLLQASLNMDYRASKGVTEKGGELVGAIAIKELLKLKWWNKPNMRLKVNKQLQKMGMGEKEASEAIRQVIVAGATKSKVSRAKNSSKKRHKASNAQRTKGGVAKQQANPMALKNLINSVLPQMVAMKMQPPSLRYRTGRFANSAQVTKVTQGPRGGLQADYTYMRNPYETFEPGGKQGSTMRDPRVIIGQSIREIVAQGMENKFIKVRRI